VCLAALDPTALESDRDAVRRALSGVARARGTVGLAAVAAMLAGDRSRRVISAGLDKLSTFGVLAGRTPEEVMGVLRALLANGWIDLSEGDFPVPRITPLGWQVVTGELMVRVRLPTIPRRTRPRAERPKRVAPEPLPPPAPTDTRPPDNDLFQALRAHRASLARSKAVPPYVIAHDRTLLAIAAAQPRTDAELLKCHGMGPGRLASYGAGFLAVVRAHAGDGGLGSE
jgi:ATP-dependent DNA helicase RecQ